MGLHLKPSLLGSSSSVVQFMLLGIDPFTYYKDTVWIKSIEKRMMYEQGIIPYELTDFKFLPRLGEKCTPYNYGQFTQDCTFGFYNTTADYTIKVDQDEYKMADIEKLIAKWNITDRAKELYKLSRDGLPLELKNPEVPIVSVNLRSMATDIRYTYGPDLRKYVDDDKFYEPTVDTGMGDGSVVSYSQFIPLLKWAKEYDDGQKGAQPVKFVDFCSIYKNRYDPYDEINEFGEKIISENGFFGISCDCIKDKTPGSCNHGVMIKESNLLKLLESTLKTNENSFSINYKEFVESLEDEYLITITHKCPQDRKSVV